MITPPSFTDRFRTRLGLITALIGMAVGTGNIWRFPRIMAQNGGGAFLIPWAIFLFIWSIPLLAVEFGLGQRLRHSPAVVFARLTQGRWAWMGAFIVLCTSMIMFYYCVVTGWCFDFLIGAIDGTLLDQTRLPRWDHLTASPSRVLFWHIVSALLCAGIVAAGIRNGVERVSRLAVPLLFAVLVFLALFCLFLPGRAETMRFILHCDFSVLKHHKTWLEALTQSAWSTGAGWGLALTYACYSRKNDHPVTTPLITGLSNNFIELTAALIILPTLFTFFPIEDISRLTSEGNTGLTFVVLPQLFGQLEQGRFLAFLFFFGLFLAAFTSLIAMFEMAVTFFKDIGLTMKKAVSLTTALVILIGAPSAVSVSFLENQDWVWGLGLLINGFFFCLLMLRYGTQRFVQNFLKLKSSLVRNGFSILFMVVIPLAFISLMIWWGAQAVSWDPKGWWHPLKPFSVGTCLIQWSMALILLKANNNNFSKFLTKQ